MFWCGDYNLLAVSHHHISDDLLHTLPSSEQLDSYQHSPMTTNQSTVKRLFYSAHVNYQHKRGGRLDKGWHQNIILPKNISLSLKFSILR